MACHPEPPSFGEREPALSEVEGDLGAPRECLAFFARYPNRALGAHPIGKLHHYRNLRGGTVSLSDILKSPLDQPTDW
jgi:hypothetical protein